MKKPFRLFALLMVPAIALSLSLLTACGDDEGGGGDDTDATFSGATPASGEVPAGSAVTLAFSKDPGAVTASAGTISGAGTSRTLTLPNTPGAVSITITWGSAGSASLSYTLGAPDTEAPTLVSSSPSDGDSDVDPGSINADGIVLTFSEPVSGTIQVTEDGANLNWRAQPGGSSADKTLTPGSDLVNEKTYEVVIDVKDGGGNALTTSISFTTAAKE